MKPRLYTSSYSKSISTLRRRFLTSLFFSSLLAATIFGAAYQTSAAVLQNDESQQAAAANKFTNAEQIQKDQQKLADQYRLLEEKLFSLYEYEQDTNPVRSQLLKRAFVQSQENMTASELKMIVTLLDKGRLKDAEQDQAEILKELNLLLKLLQSEDRGSRVRDEIQRHQEYLKEVERILRIQKGLRGQTEGGVDGRRLSNSQQKTADRTQRLGDDIAENEEPENDGSNPSSDSTNGEDSNGKDSESESDGNQEDERDLNEGGESDGNKLPDGESPDGNPSDGNPSDGNPSDGKPRDGNSQSNPGGEPAQGSGQPGQPGESGQGSPNSNQSDQNPIRKRIQAAEQRMRDAQKNLEQSKRDDAIEAMRDAEREMALAKKELEGILRQLREEEVERTLAMLEGRFRQMLERQVRVLGSTQKLEKTPTSQRGPDFEIQTGKLSAQQTEIATEAARALMLLREDGSSIAFPATVEEMHHDMLQVAGRLKAARVGRITIEIEEDIVDTLDYLIKALVKTQQDMERMKKGQQQGGGQPGDRPLVDQLAEIKMLRGLQERIYKRHQRYARLLNNPADPIGATEDPEMRVALKRLADRQSDLTDIARDLVNGKNQ